MPYFLYKSRLDWYTHEKKFLAPYAFASKQAEQTRLQPESAHPYRTPFQRDRDRIIHSRAFRRLKHKRQVFLVHVGDHFRTRLTHTMEVAQISRTMARALGLNEDLTEAIALGHDLGHTPFGHLGESVMDRILRGKLGIYPDFPEKNLGGFKHNYQSLRVVDLLEQKYDFPGLNLTFPVREGILKHTRLKIRQIRYPLPGKKELNLQQPAASTLEGQIVALADEIAQRTHDLEDGLRAGLVQPDDVLHLEIIRLARSLAGKDAVSPSQSYAFRNQIINDLINLLVGDAIQQSLDNVNSWYKRGRQLSEQLVHFSPGLDPLQLDLNRFIYQHIIFREQVSAGDDAAKALLQSLYLTYARNPDILQDYHAPERKHQDLPRRICDHIAGMTDKFALAEAGRLQASGQLAGELDLKAFAPLRDIY